jgi:hypothetical protein
MIKFIIFVLINSLFFSLFYFLYDFKNILINNELTSLFVSVPISVIIYSFSIAIIETFFIKNITKIINEKEKKKRKDHLKVIK